MLAIFQKRNIKKLKIFFMIVSFFVIIFGISFATGTTNTGNSSEGGNSFGSLFISIVDLLGNIWFIFPIIAGKLLTNDLVYGHIFHLETTLWHMRNFSRTLANFIIGFLFIYMILKYTLILYDTGSSAIKNWLPKIVVASIFVNMSRFLMQVLIDLSTIFIAAFGSMASSMGTPAPPLVMPKQIEISVQKCNPSKDTACIMGNLTTRVKKKNKLTLANLQQYETTLSGPLMFFGAGLLEITTSKNKLLTQAYDFQSHKFKHNGEAIKALIRIVLFLLFLIPIIILIVVNIVRIFRLRIYISFSPLLFLDWIWGKNKLAGSNKAFALKNVMGLIFSPALVVLGFAISTILILGVADALNTTEGSSAYEESVKKTFLLEKSGNGVLEIDFGGSKDTGKIASKYIGGFLGYMIMTMLLVILIWGVLKLSFKASEVTSGISDKMFKFSEDLMKTIPIPTPMGGVSLGSLQKMGDKIQAIPSGMLSKQTERLNSFFNKQSDVTESRAKEIIDGAGNNSSRSSSINDLFTEIEKFKGKTELENSPNAKSLIDAIVKGIHNNGTMSNLESDLNSASTYQDKLKILLRNEDTIKQKLG